MIKHNQIHTLGALSIIEQINTYRAGLRYIRTVISA